MVSGWLEEQRVLPRMNEAFGRADWLVNGVLFAAHRLRPRGMPAILMDAAILSYRTKRYQSAWIGIAVRSTQTVLVAAMVWRWSSETSHPMPTDVLTASRS